MSGAGGALRCAMARRFASRRAAGDGHVPPPVQPRDDGRFRFARNCGRTGSPAPITRDHVCAPAPVTGSPAMAHLWTDVMGTWSIVPLASGGAALVGGDWTPRGADQPLAAAGIAITRAQGDGLVQLGARRAVARAAARACQRPAAAARRPRPRRPRRGRRWRRDLLLLDRDPAARGAVRQRRADGLSALQDDDPPARTERRVSGCRTRYHQHDARPCWLYGEACALCGRPTALDQPYAWTPAAL